MSDFEIAIPVGLDAAVMGILGQRVGRKNVIGRFALVELLGRMGWQASERVVRECIKHLRRRGHLICGLAGVNGGYYLAETLDEFDAFDRAEFEAKIADMSETRSAMKKAARQQFGEGVQLSMM